MSAAERQMFRRRINNNLELYSYDELALEKRYGALPLVSLDKDRPMVVLLIWLHAKPRHVKKFLDIYLGKGFDALAVSIKVWQALWPTFGSQVIATDILEFLHDNTGFRPLFVHGFSVGGYLWSEVLVKVQENPGRYKPVMDRIKGQVFDSPPSEPPEMQQQVSVALFPNNAVLRILLQYTLALQQFLFYNVVTKPMKLGYKTAHYPPVKIPSLLFVSKDDPISPFDLNMNILETWKSIGIQAEMKWWEHSPHIGHFVHHQKEYMEHLDSLLESVGLNNLPRKDTPA